MGISGFCGCMRLNENSNVLHVQIPDQKESSFVNEDLFIEKKFLGKFYNDETLYSNDSVLVALNGVVLNSKKLLDKHNKKKIGEALFQDYKESGLNSIKQLRGSFSGLIFDKKTKNTVIFTNHFGDKQVFYCEKEGYLFFASTVALVIEMLRKQNFEVSVDESGVRSMLSYGFMLEDLTLIKGIKKLPYGCALEVSSGDVRIVRYWNFNNIKTVKGDATEILKNVELLFQKAVKLEFDKDIEYGYEHFNTLSAGLDSRMTFHVAHELGYKNIVNFTYSLGGYSDQEVAQKMADDLGHSFMYNLLNKNNFFENFDEVVKITEGRCSLLGNISGYNSARHINFQNKGIVHTGQLGDVVMGTFCKVPYHTEPVKYSGSMSPLKYAVFPEIDLSNFANSEAFLMTQRGFNGALQGNLIYQQHSEVCSPFMDVDFFEYCLSIPVEMRFNHKLYTRWIREFHPVAAGYLWEKIQAPLTAPAIRFGNKILPLSNLLHVKSVLLPRIGKVWKMFSGYTRKHSMTPMQYWYDTNLDLQRIMNTKIEDSGINLLFSGTLNKAILDICDDNEVQSKTQLFTISEALTYLKDTIKST